MGWLDSLKEKIGDVELGVAGKKPARTKTPRDLLLQSIDDSMAFLKDPKFRLTSGRRKGKQPDLVYATDGNRASISLRYARVRIKLDGKNDELAVDTKHLAEALSALRAGVIAGEFDTQLTKLQADRSAAVKAGRSKKA